MTDSYTLNGPVKCILQHYNHSFIYQFTQYSSLYCSKYVCKTITLECICPGCKTSCPGLYRCHNIVLSSYAPYPGGLPYLELSW